MTQPDTRLDRLAESGKWFIFAVAANDRRRSFYANMIARARSSEMRKRRDARLKLPKPSVTIDRGLGFETCDQSAFGGTADLVAEVQQLSETLFSGNGSSEKPYLANASLAGVPPSSALLRFGLNDQLLASVAEYLGTVPILVGIYALRSTHVPGPPAGSQLYHCDWEAVRQVKVFVHCTPVTVDSGPLTAISATASLRLKQAINYRYGGAGFRVPDERVRPEVSEEEIQIFTGPTGAVTLIDTSSCFHFGSRITEGSAPRLVVQFQYLAPDAFDLLLKRRSSHRQKRNHTNHSEIGRLVLEGLAAGPSPRVPEGGPPAD